MRISRRQMIAGSLVLTLPGTGHAAIAPATWLKRWLAAFNDTHAATYRDFVNDHVPALVAYLDDDLALREATGGFVLLRSEKTGPNEITAWVRDRNWDRFSRVVLSIGEDRIDDLSFLAAPSPAGFAVPRLGARDALAGLGRKLRIEAEAGRFSGTVLVARNGSVLFRRAYGAQGPGKARRVTPATRFCLGSMGKMFTAVSVLHLVQAGRLRLTDTIATLLPVYPDTALAREVTVRHLLTHTAGTGDFFGPDYEAHVAELRTPSDFIRLFGGRAAAFPPGSRWGYSNFGFILLGAIVEQVSGLEWQAYQDRHIFRVAGMTATSPVASPADTAVAAHRRGRYRAEGTGLLCRPARRRRIFDARRSARLRKRTARRPAARSRPFSSAHHCKRPRRRQAVVARSAYRGPGRRSQLWPWRQRAGRECRFLGLSRVGI